MDFKIEILRAEEVNDFGVVFAEVLKKEFSFYSPKIVDFFLTKIYIPLNFSFWIVRNLRTIIIAKTNGKIIGFSVIDQPYGGISFCRWLGVRREFQKMGAGKLLIKKWIELAKNQKCHKIEVAAQPDARGFYEKMGLDYEGKRKLSYFGIDQFVFGKIIGEPNEEEMVKYY